MDQANVWPTNALTRSTGIRRCCSRSGQVSTSLRLRRFSPKLAMIAAMPGAAEAVAGANYKQGFMPGVMGLGSQLMAGGLGMGEITGVAKETIRFGREKLGGGEVDEIVAAIPGLGQFV